MSATRSLLLTLSVSGVIIAQTATAQLRRTSSSSTSNINNNNNHHHVDFNTKTAATPPCSLALADDVNNTCDGKPRGVYTIAGIDNIFCDGSGRAVIQSYSRTACGDQNHSLVSSITDGIDYHHNTNSHNTNSNHNNNNNININNHHNSAMPSHSSSPLSTCGYLSESVVRTLAGYADAVVLLDWGKTAARSTDPVVIEALRTSGNWYNTPQSAWVAVDDHQLRMGASAAAAASSGSSNNNNVNDLWNFNATACGPELALLAAISSWPNMVQGCEACHDCVHWLSSEGHVPSRTARSPSIGTSTFLEMKKLCPVPAPVIDDCTCYGKAPGRYTIAGVDNVYCEHNAAMLQNNNGCPLSSYGVQDAISPSTCGYLSASQVAVLAMHGESVVLRDGTPGRGAVESTSAVQALIDGTSWHGQGITWEGIAEEGTTTTTWSFLIRRCSSSRATGWPEMNHACGNRGGVYWLSAKGHSSTPAVTSSSRTMLRMKNTCAGGGPIPPAATTTTCADTCFGKPAGAHSFSGQTVYCDGNNRMLLQHYALNSCPSYGFADRYEGVTPEKCGYLPAASVKLFARSGSKVTLEDEGYGSVESAAAVKSLLDGTNWHTAEVTGTWTGDSNSRYYWRMNPVRCVPSLATGWPEMIDACRVRRGVKWLSSVGLEVQHVAHYGRHRHHLNPLLYRPYHHSYCTRLHMPRQDPWPLHHRRG